VISYEFFIQTEKKNIDFINKIIEAYEGIGIVRTLDPKEGTIKIISIDIYKEFIREILADFEKNNVKAEILKEGPWAGVL